jgi:hypothetical protein
VLKLLLIAPTCDRDDVGEAWVAYQWARRLADRHDVSLLTYHKRRSSPVSSQLTGCRVVEWAEPPGLGRAGTARRMLKPGYLPFYLRAGGGSGRPGPGRAVRPRHQPSPGGVRYPSRRRAGHPFIMGPVRGSLQSRRALMPGGTAAWYVGCGAADGLRIRRDPLLRRTYSRRAACSGSPLRQTSCPLWR